jgi:hypothetical protein
MSETSPNQEPNQASKLVVQSQENSLLSSRAEEAQIEEISPSLGTSENVAVKELESEESEVESQPELAAESINLELQKSELFQESIAELEAHKQTLRAEIKLLQDHKTQLLSEQMQMQQNIGRMIGEGVKELEQKKQELEISIQKLERRQERIKEEMRTTFAGVSQDLAIRVQGFKDYLTGSLQDLAAAAEQLELPTATFQAWEAAPPSEPQARENQLSPQFAQRSFQEERKQIRSLLDQYRTRPDYYGPPWQLRRTFEPIHGERVANWFFTQGGRGAIRTMGSRLQNILIASAVISVLYNLYGDRSLSLLLANTPERLGEWRRGLQDCLGISRSDFGPERGVMLFENPEALSQKADRLIEEQKLPLVIIDQSEDMVSLSLLQFPLWLAFAPEPQTASSNYFY